MDAQTKAFQALKPICVGLGDAVRSLIVGKGKTSTISEHLDQLKRVLTSHTARPGALHRRLAEYVFFPISQVLRISQRASIQCLELSLQCIAILVDQGWKQHLPAQTAAQLVILCTLLAEKKPQGLPFAESTEELQASAFWCLYHIFTVAAENGEIKQLLITEAHFPQLGKTISTSLDAVEDSGRSMVQAAASISLEALLMHVADLEIHASFLPGITSKLTKTLTPSTKGRSSAQVLVRSLDIVQLLLKSTLAEQRSSSHNSSSTGSSKASIITGDWQLKAATQLRPALSSIMQLRSHPNQSVQLALGRLCFTILRSCRSTLANCSTLAIETLTVLSDNGDGSLSIEFEMLLQADRSVSVLLEELLYEWLQSLPTAMQSADEEMKALKMRQVRKSYDLLAQNGTVMDSIDRTAASALQDSVVVTLTPPATKSTTAAVPRPLQSLDLTVLDERTGSTEFESPLVKYKGQQDIMQAIEYFTKFAVGHGSHNLSRSMVRSLRQASGDHLLANFWLLLVASETAFEQRSEGDALLSDSNDRPRSLTEQVDELYSFALRVLTTETDNEQDPRLQALALRALALQARMAGKDFRYELLDALYPVLHMLATTDDMLQRASITTLNNLTSACEYSSVRDLIVDNVDYLTNAVALKLNAFDVSPQAPQVLLMMLKLAGPTLLPYLEDTVESIFAALEDYHGYPLLVELLFKVLGVMAEEGVKTPQLAIEATEHAIRNDNELSDAWSAVSIRGLATQLRLTAQDEVENEQSNSSKAEPHPKRPWKAETNPSRLDDAEDLSEDVQNQAVDEAQNKPPAPRTYSLLLKITELTQHFLPSASQSLRTSSLGLIRITAPALAKHENSFLPLINTLWPEVVARLDDDEAYIIATALDIVRVLCESAGDFMRTRISQLWPRLLEIRQRTTNETVQSQFVPHRPPKTGQSPAPNSVIDDPRPQQALMRTEQSPSTFGNASSRLLWSSLQALMTVTVQYVHMPPEYFDEALQVVAHSLSQQSVKAAFEQENADAVWLALLRNKAVEARAMPVVPPGRGWRFAAVAG